MENYSTIASPLTKFTHYKVKFLWSDACKGSFEKMKDKLTLFLVLTLPKGYGGIVVYSDASCIGIGCILI